MPRVRVRVLRQAGPGGYRRGGESWPRMGWTEWDVSEETLAAIKADTASLEVRDPLPKPEPVQVSEQSGDAGPSQSGPPPVTTAPTVEVGEAEADDELDAAVADEPTSSPEASRPSSGKGSKRGRSRGR